MLEAFFMFIGFFATVIAVAALYCFVFDRPRWEKALANARAAGVESRAKAKIKNDERERKRVTKTAELLAWGEAKQKAMKDKQQEQQNARTEAKQTAEEDRIAHMAVGQSRRSRVGRQNQTDPLLSAVVGGLAAASLAGDIKGAIVNHGIDEDVEADWEPDEGGSDGDW